MPKPQLPSGTALACLSAALPTEEGPPTEFRIFPKGKFDTQKGDYVFDDVAAASVIAASQQWGNEYSLDYEHAVLANPPAPAPAAGWFGLEAREDGLWAVNVRWTEKAAAYLSAREYRYWKRKLLRKLSQKFPSFNGARTFQPGKPHWPGPPQLDAAGFNGARTFQPGKLCAGRACGTRSRCFNGARTFQPGKRSRHSQRWVPSPGFNGARTFQPGKPRKRSLAAWR